MSDSSVIKILLADDHPLMRQATRLWLEKNEDMRVIAEASDGMEAVDIARRLNPTVVILDISMPYLNGIEATKQILSCCPKTKVLILTVHTDNKHIQEILEAGASGYLSKNILGEEIVHAVRKIISGERVPYYSVPPSNPDATNVVSNKTQSDIFDLNPRELKILKLIANGESNKSIAAKMDLSLRVVKSALTTIYIKLGATSRTEAISIGLKSGILSVTDLER